MKETILENRIAGTLRKRYLYGDIQFYRGTHPKDARKPVVIEDEVGLLRNLDEDVVEKCAPERVTKTITVVWNEESGVSFSKEESMSKQEAVYFLSKAIDILKSTMGE